MQQFKEKKKSSADYLLHTSLFEEVWEKVLRELDLRNHFKQLF